MAYDVPKVALDQLVEIVDMGMQSKPVYDRDGNPVGKY